MQSANERFWESLTERQRRICYLLLPFRGAINLVRPILEKLVVEVNQTISPEPLLQYKEMYAVFTQLPAYGLAMRVLAFPDTELLQLLPGVHQWLAEKHPAETETWTKQQIETVYRHYYVHMADQLHTMWLATLADERSENLLFLRYEIENLQNALRLGIEQQDFDFSHALTVLEIYWTESEQTEERLRYCRQLAQTLEATPEANRYKPFRFALVHVLDSIADSLTKLKRFPEAIIAYHRTLDSYRRLQLDVDFPHAERVFHQKIASVYSYLDEWKNRDWHHEQSFRISQKFEDQEGIADYHLCRGKDELQLRAYDCAHTHFDTARTLYEELQLADWQAVCLDYLGYLETMRHRFPEAEQHLNAAAELFERQENALRRAGVHLHQSLLAFVQYDFAQTLHHARAAISTYLRSEDKPALGRVFLLLFAGSVGMHRWGECMDYLNQAATVFRKIGDVSRVDLCEQLRLLVSEDVSIEEVIQKTVAGLKSG